MKARLGVCAAFGIFALCGAASADLVDCYSAVENKDMRQILLNCDASEIKWAAEQGDARAQYMIADLYRFGELGVEQNMRAAINWYAASAEQGNVDAQLSLANIYRSGQGAAKNSAEAYRLYTSAAKLGSAEAQLQLGLFYQLEIMDPLSSYMWVTVAALNGYERAVEHKALIDKSSDAFLLSDSDLLRGAELAQLCLESGYTDCDGR